MAAVRRYGQGNAGEKMTIDAFIELIQEEIKSKKMLKANLKVD